MLGEVRVTKAGLASVSTEDLTKLTHYRIKAVYTPTNSKISKSQSAPVVVPVIPQPIQVPTTVSLYSGAKIAETGQHVSLVAVVQDAGVGNQVNAGKVQRIKGKVEFFVNSPAPVLIATENLSKKDEASLSTDKFKATGPYQIQAVFVPSNKFYTTSTSPSVSVTITPKTVNSPTASVLQTTTSVVETGEPVTLSASAMNADSSLADGNIEFLTVSRHPVELADVPVASFGQQVTIGTGKLQKVGIYHVEAVYEPNSNRFAQSISAPITIAVTPLTAASFRVTPVVNYGKLNKPVSFDVTALNIRGEPVTTYTGTVVLTSPTDSWTTFPPSIYASLHISAPPPQSTGLATYNPQLYTFTPADHGSHTFVNGVTFGKAGAESLQVTQANDPKVHGKAVFAIE